MIDVIIPTRNRPHLTGEAVQSVLAQTYRDLRVIVVDDASSGAALPDQTDRRVSVIRRDIPGGPQAARQTGLEASGSRYVALLDSDDLWHPTKLERQLELLEGVGRVDAVLTWYCWIHDGRVDKVGRPKLPQHPLMTDNMSCPLFTRESLARVGGFLPPDVPKLPTAEHLEFWIRFSAVGSVAVAAEVLTTCRSHGGQRESAQLGTSEAAEAMKFVVERYRDHLAAWPEDLALLLAKLGARQLDARSMQDGLTHLRQSLEVAPRRYRIRLLRQFGPFAVKALARRGQAPDSPE